MGKHCRLSFIIALITLLFISPASIAQQLGRVLYVNRTAATCGGQSPCYTSIQAAIDAANSRDTIRIQAGSYPEQLQIQKNDFIGATESDRIIIEADPAASPGTVVLSGGGSSSCTNNFGIRIKQSKYVTVRDLTITGYGAQAISLMGGNNGNVGIHIIGNRIFGNGLNNNCDGGITVARGNPDTLIVNNLIYGNGRNGANFIDPDGGPHYVLNNTIYGNGWNGVNVGRNHQITLANNLIFQNGLASGATGGRFGVLREASTNPQPAGIMLLSNLICANVGAEINGPALDSADAGNVTPNGNEGPGVSTSAGCYDMANVFANLKGADNILNTVDDDPNLRATSPAVDNGIDTRTLGLNPLLSSILESDFFIDSTRPRDGNRSRSAEFDIGAIEYIASNQAPVSNAGQDRTVTEGTLTTLDGSSSYDPEGDALLYQWIQTAGPTISLANPTSINPSFTAPPVTALTDLDFKLTVSDWATSSSDSVRITVIKPNRSPVLSPIGNRTLNIGSTLTFTVRAIDPDNDPLTYSVSPLPLPANAGFDTNTRVFTFIPTASQVGSFNLTFAASDGRGGTASETITVTVTAGLTIAITNPPNGATVSAGQLIVRGTVTNSGGGEVGVTVNGFPAGVQGNNFTTAVVLAPDTTSLTAVATSQIGTTATHTVPIAVSTAAPSPIVLHALPTSGAVPLNVRFSLFGDVQITQVTLDADGDGNIDFTGSQLAEQPFTFLQSGTYVATARATDSQGNQLAANAVVQVFDLTQLDGILQARWAAMKDALRAGNIPAALSHIMSRARPRYEEGFQIISAQLPNIDDILTAISLVRIGNNEAVYKASRTDEGIPMSFEVRFTLDVDGLWRVASF